MSHYVCIDCARKYDLKLYSDSSFEALPCAICGTVTHNYGPINFTENVSRVILGLRQRAEAAETLVKELMVTNQGIEMAKAEMAIMATKFLARAESAEHRVTELEAK